MMSWKKVHEYSSFLVVKGGAAEEAFTTPMRFASVIRLDAEGKRESIPMRWGFAERRAKTPMERPKHMHARSETIDTLPTFADAFAQA